MPRYVFVYNVVSSFILALIPAISFECIKLDDEIKRVLFVTSLVILWLLLCTCHPYRDILSTEFIRADGVKMSKICRLNNKHYSKSYLYHKRYNENASFEHSD